MSKKTENSAIHYQKPVGVILWLCAGIVLISACSRLNRPQPPENVPDSAEYDRRAQLWSYEQEDGHYYQYYDDGSLAAEGFRNPNGSRSGPYAFYLRDGTLTTEGEYYRNRRDGIWKHYDDDGNLYLTIEYQPEPVHPILALITSDYGNENGPYVRYYPDGSVEEEGHYVGGERHGSRRRYYRNGNLMIRGQFSEDEKDGRWLYYDRSGRLEREENFTAGKLHGVLRNFKNGKLYFETFYENDVEKGPRSLPLLAENESG